jgi:prephenate dehydrogenase
MAGTENSGPKAALAGLFAHKTAVICEREKSSPEALGAITKILDGLRMRIVYMNPKDHDLHAAYVSHLSHISSFVLANTVLLKERDAATIFDLAGGGFESTVRLAKSSSQMWAPIFAQNKNKVSQALQVYIDELKTFKDAVDKEDMPKLVKLMDRANEIRRVLNEMARRTRE